MDSDMSAWEHAKWLYSMYPDQSMTLDILEYAQYHFCHITPTWMILAKDLPAEDCWHIFLAVGRGCMAGFFGLAPHARKFVSFRRPMKGRHDDRKYEYERVKHICESFLNIEKNTPKADSVVADQAVLLRPLNLPPLPTPRITSP